jgi:transcription antitermination protein NusB
MLSRRSVRVKVMQLLFNLGRDKDLTQKDVLKRYQQSIEDAYELYLLNFYTLLRICRWAGQDEKKRKEKHLPSDYDKKFSAKLYQNEAIQSAIGNKSLEEQFDKYAFLGKIDEDMTEGLYKEFSKTEAYQSYMLDDDADDTEILLELYRFCRQNELFNEAMEDAYSCWLDDKSLVVGAVKKSLKALPAQGAFYRENLPQDETVSAFGENLLIKCIEEDESLLKLIEPTLENWDTERVAVIDMILLKMAVCEFLYFETIPTKVTLNEFVEIAKNYSTDKSKDFINGILDRLMRELSEAGKINKLGRGLIEE